MEWFYTFPQMNADSLRDLKKGIDEGFRAFTRAHGDRSNPSSLRCSIFDRPSLS